MVFITTMCACARGFALCGVRGVGLSAPATRATTARFGSQLRAGATGEADDDVYAAFPRPPASSQRDTDMMIGEEVDMMDEACKRLKINWYPGHIAKAERQLTEALSRVDLVIEARRACDQRNETNAWPGGTTPQGVARARSASVGGAFF